MKVHDFSIALTLPSKKALEVNQGSQLFRLNYEQYGVPEARSVPLVFLHGINSGAASWYYQQLCFQKDHFMLHWNMPGYGNSDAPFSQPLAHDYADVLYAFLQQKKVTNFILIGHSLGALVAYAYSQRYGQTLKGLLLASVTPGYGHKSVHEQTNIAQLRPTLYQERGQAGYIEANLSRLASSVTGTRYNLIEKVLSRISLEGITASSYLLAHSTIAAYRHRVQVPFMCVCGKEDRITAFDEVLALSQTLGAEFTAIPEAGHPCYLENKDAFNTALQTFIQTI